jgi:hypothetical protein
MDIKIAVKENQIKFVPEIFEKNISYQSNFTIQALNLHLNI